MKRTDGYIDLCYILDLPRSKQTYEYELNILDKLSENKDVKILKFEPGLRLLFSFWYESERYFFSYDGLGEPITELLVGFIADDLEVKHVEYDVAKIGEIRGTIARDYTIEGARYLSGEDFLMSNIDYEIDDDSIDTYGYEEARLRESSRYNSLEGIWFGLECRYKDQPLIVEKLMEGIVDMFIIDALTGQRDRHFDNWKVVENPNGSVELMPLFDNLRAFVAHPIMCRMGLGVNNLNKEAPITLLEKNLEHFVKQSSREFVSRLIDSLWVLLSENVDKIFERIESRMGVPLKEEDMWDYRVKFATQLKYLMDCLNVASVEMPKRIRLQD